MRIDNPLIYARSVRTEHQAGAALAAIEHEISYGNRAERWYEEADEALAHIHARWPRAHMRDSYRQPPPLSHPARKLLWSNWPEDAATPHEPDGDAHRRASQVNTFNERADLRRSHRRRGIRHTLEAAGLLAALAAVIALLVRHPRHALAGGVVLVALASGRPSLIVTAATVGAMVALVRRRPGALNPPRPPRAPRTPSALRVPAPPRWPR
jgi:hypothetical protein